MFGSDNHVGSNNYLQVACVLAAIRMISWHWQIVSGLVLFVDKPINETSLQHRIYFGRALPNWGVVVSHQGNRRGAATLVTQESHPFRVRVCQLRLAIKARHQMECSVYRIACG